MRGTCLVSQRERCALHKKRNDALEGLFQSPCAGNMFGKVDLKSAQERLNKYIGFNPRVRGTCLVRSCNMRLTRSPTSRSRRRFQSPCAGNMFGKSFFLTPQGKVTLAGGFNPRVRGTCLVRCCTSQERHATRNQRVSISVCGEHVW